MTVLTTCSNHIWYKNTKIIYNVFVVVVVVYYQRKLDPEVVPPIPRKFREILDKADCTFSVFCLCYLELSEVNLYLMRTLTGS